jgi:hypothetical protein
LQDIHKERLFVEQLHKSAIGTDEANARFVRQNCQSAWTKTSGNNMRGKYGRFCRCQKCISFGQMYYKTGPSLRPTARFGERDKE